MTTRTWIGGGTNNIFSAADWSPAGIPAAGDTLVMLNGTANLYGGDLTGETFLFGVAASFSQASPVLNVYNGAKVTLTEGGSGYSASSPTVNVFGRDTVNIVEASGGQRTVTSKLNLEPQAVLSGSVQIAGYTTLTIQGATGSSFNNTNTSIGYNSVATIDANVIGIGSFNLTFYSGAEFGGSVSQGQTLNLANGSTDYKIDHPSEFYGTINWLVAPSAYDASVDLLNITADSYKFSNNQLTLFAGNTIVDRLHLNGSSGAFGVYGVSGGVTLQSIGTPVGSGEILLPVHA
jgi:hypothetical protein